MSGSSASTPEEVGTTPGLAAEIALRAGSLEMDVEFHVRPGQVMGLLGPNGAGKTSLLHALAGLRKPTRGRITLDGRTLDDAEAGVHRPASERRAGVAFQEDLLFPHLSVLENVAFGLRARGVSRTEAHDRAGRWLHRLHAGELATRRPDRLSGGEGQRVALARALATAPDFLLLDEPLSALDAQSRLDVRRELTSVLRGFEGPVILVTHDPLEAVGLADRLLILEDGRIVQEGTAEEVTSRPRSPWAARLLGLNFFRGISDGAAVRVGPGFSIRIDDGPTGEVCGVFEPSRVRVDPVPAGERRSGRRGETREDGRSSWLASVEGVESLGSRFRLHLGAPLPLVAEIALDAGEIDLLSQRDVVRVAVRPESVRTYAP